jgi:hypothetical protein
MRSGKGIGVLLVVMMAGGAPACSPQAANDGTMMGALALHVQGGASMTLNSISWTVANPVLLGAPKTGTVDLSRSSAASFVVGSLPAGGGYSISISGTTSGGVSCTASGSFAINAGSATALSLDLVCSETSVDAGSNGSVSVTLGVSVTNPCAAVSIVSASPSSVDVGGSISLSAQGVDAMGGSGDVIYHWGTMTQAGDGTFSDVTSPSPTFTCTAAGKVTATVSVTTPDGGSNCVNNTASVLLTCTSPSAAESNCPPKSSWVATALPTPMSGLDGIPDSQLLPQYAIDGDLITRYSSGVVGAVGDFFQVDLGAVATVSGITVNTTEPTDVAQGYAVELSPDGVLWTAVAASDANASTVQVVNFPGRAARFVRYTNARNYADGISWFSIHEFDIMCDSQCGGAQPANYGASCGSCGGKIKCDGTCSVATPTSYGAACGSCGGTVTCDGSCSVPTPTGFGGPCGSCGGKVVCDGTSTGTCSVPTPANFGAPCNDCGAIGCNGACASQGGLLACQPSTGAMCNPNGVAIPASFCPNFCGDILFPYCASQGGVLGSCSCR